jgi:hypothetical protein
MGASGAGPSLGGVPLERPADLASRLKLGREEFCQRLLTALILDGPYPRWNTRSTPSTLGLQFLQRLHALSFRADWPGDRPEFVDELELPPRHELEKGGAPDWAVLWSADLWIIELKTEVGSHRAQQIPSYFELAAHHYPKHAVRITYLTPSGLAPQPNGPDGSFAHVTWDDVVPLVRTTWGAGTADDRRAVSDGVCSVLDQLEVPTALWRSVVSSSIPSVPTGSAAASHDDARATAALTATDGKQRAVELETTGLEELLALRVEMREHLAAASDGSGLRRVQPWLWDATRSGGRPLTRTGAETGMELRFSRYERDLYS